ncbi:hypothetical protein CP532_0338 [Ophiocordyceps camponoti-leonardi (nom. inval.)]|nr:hypothetical protein CP532_0338 [Ophiocordyceps camponoti-leonardi (nom. inval.)]
MASWYSSIVTKTTSQLSSLRATLLSSEADGDDDDDTHVCRVLRNYYTDKGRPLPAWLPPDPKAPAPTPVAQPPPQQPAVGSRYGSAASQQQSQSQQGGGLSSLWGNDQSSSRNNRADLAPPRPQMNDQRPGSYQTPSSTSSSAQDRLRQRLRGPGAAGVRTASPQGPHGPFAPPTAAESPRAGGRAPGLPSDPRRAGGGGPRGYR